MKQIEFPYHRRITVGFFIVAGFVIIMVLPSMLFTIIEDGIADKLTVRYWFIPSITLTILGVTLYYFTFFSRLKQKRYDNNMRNYLHSVFRIFLTSVLVAGGLMCLAHRLILFSNSFPEAKEIFLDEPVIRSHTHKNKGTTYDIVLHSKQLNREVRFSPKKAYKTGERFTKKLKMGRWGILYAQD